MVLLSWSDSYSVKVPSIDNQHKKWIDYMNELHMAMSEGHGKEILSDIFKKFIKYGNEHLDYEERLLDENDYPELHQHRKEHDYFRKKLSEFDEKQKLDQAFLSIQVMDFMKDWLLNHIKGTDMKYSNFLTAKGVK